MKRLLAIGSVVCLTAFLLLLGCTEDPVPDYFSKPSVTTSYVNVSFGSVKLTCGISNTNFRECGFYYGTKQDLSDKRSVRATMSADGKNAEALLNNLEAGETYYFQAYIDGGRNVATSGIGSFTVSNVMDVDATGFQLTYAETDIQVTVETNLTLEVDLGGATWIKETRTKGLETYHKVFHISRNSELTSRKATIKISSTDGEFTKEIPVEQGGGPIDIPDKVFKAYLVENFDKDGDGEIVISELEAIERMDVGCSDKIRSLKGIEYCSNLKYLRCYGPPEGAERGSGILSYVDVTHCPELEEINLWGNQIAQVDLSGSTKIKYIHLGHNKLSSINISMLSSLQYLSVEENQLKSLDVSNNTALTEIHCYNNQFTTLDVSNNTALTRFLCYNNPDLTKIWLTSSQTIADLQYDKEIATILFVDAVSFADANFKAYCVEYFDKDGDGEISWEEADYVTAIDVFTDDILSLDGIEGFTNLESLSCGGSFGQISTGKWGKLSEIKVSNNKKLRELHFDYCHVSKIDVSENQELRSLWCMDNGITSLDVSQNSKLRDLQCGQNPISSIDVSNNMALESFGCQYCELTGLDVSNNTALIRLDCYSNQLTSLDVSKNVSLSTLVCHTNPRLSVIWLKTGQTIETLEYDKSVATICYVDNAGFVYFADSKFREYCIEHFDENYDLQISLSEAEAVTWIDICTDNIQSLAGIEYFTNLTSLTCKGSRNGSGKLASLDVSSNVKLGSLDCSNNQLTRLDISSCRALGSLHCDNNRLAELDITHNARLTTFSCSGNLLTALDISYCPYLVLNDYNTVYYNLIYGNNLATIKVWKGRSGVSLDNISIIEVTPDKSKLAEYLSQETAYFTDVVWKKCTYAPFSYNDSLVLFAYAKEWYYNVREEISYFDPDYAAKEKGLFKYYKGTNAITGEVVIGKISFSELDFEAFRNKKYDKVYQDGKVVDVGGFQNIYNQLFNSAVGNLFYWSDIYYSWAIKEITDKQAVLNADNYNAFCGCFKYVDAPPYIVPL